MRLNKKKNLEKKNIFFFFDFSRAALMAYGGSRARGPIGAVPFYTTATSDPSCVCDLHHSSQQSRILNPLSEAKNRTCNLMVPSRIR